MSDRRAVSAGQYAMPSVAGEMWRVAVGGNRVENMTVDEIAHAYHSGHLSERTPLWPPGTSGWQALGNFEHFQYPPAQQQMPAQHMGNGGLSQFQESDDDPTRMWTGASDLEIGGMPQPTQASMPMASMPMASMPMGQAPSAPPARPSARTGPRQVSSRAPRPVASLPPARMVSAAPKASPSVPPQFRSRRSSGWLLVAGLVGLVGLGSAVLAARGSWSVAAIEPEPTRAPAVAAAPSEVAPSAAATAGAADVPGANTAEANAPSANAPSANAAEVNGVAKYEENGASAFVAGAEPSKPAANEADPAKASADGQAAATSEAKAGDEPNDGAASVPAKSKRGAKSSKELASKTQPAPKRSAKATASSSNAKRAATSLVSKVKDEEEEEPTPAPAPSPASPSVNEAAAAALASSAKLASSCRPRGGPSGPGKARVIYSQDGEVQSVEILTAKFRDTLTGSCVRMVFRRAKIPPFKGEPPTFIKSFTIPDE